MRKFNIRPCILVTDKLTVERGCTYHRYDLQVKEGKGGSEDATWQTDRHYKNREEAKEADRIYAKARHKIRSVCVPTDIGFICSSHNTETLEKAIAEARAMVNDANAGFKHCFIKFKVLRTRIESDNAEGVEVLKDALESSVATIQSSLLSFDVTKARDTINGTKGIVAVLSDAESRKMLIESREEARELATEIHKLLKEWDGSVENAMATAAGRSILKRSKAKWNF